MEEENVIRPHQEIQALTIEEKKFLLAVERGDVAGTRRYVEIEIQFRMVYTILQTVEGIFVSKTFIFSTKFLKFRNYFDLEYRQACMNITFCIIL